MAGCDRHPACKVTLNFVPNDWFTLGRKHFIAMVMRFHHDPRPKRKVVGVADGQETDNGK
jgi:hypothetical protein